MYGAFDFVLLEVPRRFLIELAREHGFGSNVDLVCEAGEVNPVLSHLVASIEPLLAEHGKASRLFIDQLSATIGIHLIERYATVDHAGRLARPAHLSRSQFEKAREMLSSDVAGDLSIDEVARACGVSRSYFARGFKQLSGKTPHQWVISQRLAKASDMLIQTDRPLSDIALDCGFADQSHFTRVFSSNNGVPPGVWRRATRG